MVLQVHSSMYNQNLFPARTKNWDNTTRTFFSGRNSDRAPARQTIRTFFPVVITIAHPPDRQLELFFPVVITIAHPPDRRLELNFPVVIMIVHPPESEFPHFPPELKTNTTQQHNWKKSSSSPRKAWAGSSSPRNASVSGRERDFCISFCSNWPNTNWILKSFYVQINVV